MKYLTSIQFNIKLLTSSLGIEEKHVMRFLKDGRNSSFLLKFRLSEKLGFSLVEGENAPTQLFGKDGKLWIIKTCTPKSGITFCKNSMVGSGRRFNANKFLESLKENVGFLVCSLENFPEVKVYEINEKEVIKFFDNGLIKDGRMGFNAFKSIENNTSC